MFGIIFEMLTIKNTKDDFQTEVGEQCHDFMVNDTAQKETTKRYPELNYQQHILIEMPSW